MRFSLTNESRALGPLSLGPYFASIMMPLPFGSSATERLGFGRFATKGAKEETPAQLWLSAFASFSHLAHNSTNRASLGMPH
jgi:hypothetical protein